MIGGLYREKGEVNRICPKGNDVAETLKSKGGSYWGPSWLNLSLPNLKGFYLT